MFYTYISQDGSRPMSLRAVALLGGGRARGRKGWSTTTHLSRLLSSPPPRPPPRPPLTVSELLDRPLRAPVPMRSHQPLVPAGSAATEVALSPFESPPRSRTLSCCLIGPTNAGKSTLTNALIDSHVSIVSDKIHTTRENTLGFMTEGKAQVEFIDAPGALGPNVPLLRRGLWQAVQSADLALVVVDAAEKSKRTKRQLLTFLRQLGEELRQHQAEQGTRAKTALILNKVDAVHPKSKLLTLSEELHAAHSFDWPCFMVSARSGSGVEHLRGWLLLMTQPGEWSVPAGTTPPTPPPNPPAPHP